MKNLNAALLLIILTGIVGCSDSASNSKAIQAIESFTPKQVDRSFDRLHYFVLQPDLHSQAAMQALRYISDPDPVRRFVGIYLLGNTGTPDNGQALATALKDEITTYRVIAAGTLIRWGYKEAIPTLITALSDTTPLPYSKPPLPAHDLAQDALTWYTKQDLGLSTAQTITEFEAAQTQWQKWWHDNGSHLKWNGSAQKYE